ncbi:MAG: helix-turn-helix transcriptional regulator [Thermoleophilia bacterium]|nr:helix-turn-helix transcriptional regulator [Thermoleophilia bacterium]
MTTSPDQAASIDEAEPAAGNAPAHLRHDQCAVAVCAELVCAKWTLLVVRDLATGPRSYSELEASLAGISPRTLCDRLKQLAAAGMVTRTRIKGLPPRTMYELTENGRGLIPIVEAMRVVGEQLLVSPPDAAAAEQAVGDACCGD